MEEERVLILPEWRTRLENDDYKNWLKVGYGMYLTCIGIRPYVDKEAKAFHGILTAKGMAPCVCVNPHHDMAVCDWAKELKHHHTKRPTWSQSDGSKWTDPNIGYWEVAKLFMPFGCASGNVSAEETDATGLLNLLHQCDHFKINKLLVEKLKNSRNIWAHAAKQELSQGETDAAFMTMKYLLQDPELLADSNAKEALKNVNDLENKSLVDFVEIEDIETKVKIHLNELLENILRELNFLKEQGDANTQEIIDKITQVENMQYYCLKVDRERDIVLEGKINKIQSTLEGQSKDNKDDMNSSVTWRSCVCYLILQILGFVVMVLKCPGKHIPLLFLLLIASLVPLLEKNIDDLGCSQNKFDPLELKQFDFTDNLNSARESFVGRQWLFNSLTNTLSQNDSRGVLLIAAPGFGKSALISNLICSRLSSYSINTQILGFHLCIHSDRNTQNTGKFVLNLVNMIAFRIKEYRDLITTDQFLQRTLQRDCLSDPSGCFEQAIVTPLIKLSHSEHFVRPMYLVIDALDECIDENHIDDKGTSIVNVLSRKIKRFPNWLKVIATSRNVTNIRRRLGSLNEVDLLQDDERNLNDIESFLKLKFQNSFNIRSYFMGDAPILELVKGSQGNFLYIKLVLEHIELKWFDITKWNSLPTSIESVYQEFFERKFNSGEKFRVPRKLCEVLVASLHALTVDELYAVLLTEDEQLHYDYDFMIILEDMSMYLRYSSEDKCVSFFHKSLDEWLTSNRNRAGKFFVDQKEGNRLLAQYFIKNIHENSIQVDPHFVYHLATHIVKGGNLKHHVESFLDISPKIITVADNCTNITALHLAAGSVDNKILELLLNIFKTIDVKDNKGRTPVFFAAEYGQIETMKTLIKYGAYLDSNCLYYAASRNRLTILNFLLERGIKDDCIDCSDIDLPHPWACNTALHIAVIKSLPNTINMLLKSKDNALNCMNVYGRTPLHEAVQHNNYQVAKILLEHGANSTSICSFSAANSPMNERSSFCPCGFSSLHIAAYYGFPYITKLLLQYKANHDASDGDDLLPVHIASCRGHGSVLSILVGNGADVNSKNSHGMTATHFACKCQAGHLFELLAKLGADGFARTTDGRLPLDFIIENHFIDENLTFVDPYVETPVDPIDFNVINTKKNLLKKDKYAWMSLWTHFLTSFSEINEMETDTLFNLSSKLLFLEELMRTNIPQTIYGSHEISIWALKLTFLATPINYINDIGIASYDFQKLTKNGKFKDVDEKTILLERNGSQFCSAATLQRMRYNLVFNMDVLFNLGYDRINCEKSGLTPILLYLRQGGRNMVKVLVKHGVTIDIKCDNYFEDSVFHLAAYHKLHYLQYLSVFQFPNQWEDYLKTKHALFDYLFDEYEKTTHKGQVRVTRVRDGPVTKAIKSHPRGFKIIDECLDDEGYTALHRAAQGGNVVAVKHFLNWGATISLESPEGLDLLTLTICYAIKYRPHFNLHKPSLITALEIEFASFTASTILEHLTKEKPLIIGCDYKKETPTLLHLTATRGMWRFIRDLFIAKDNSKVIGLNANCPTKQGITPMYLAKVYGGEDCEWDNPWCKVVRVLLQHGASEILPERIAEYFVIFNFLFHEIPETLNLNLGKEEITLLQNSESCMLSSCTPMEHLEFFDSVDFADFTTQYPSQYKDFFKPLHTAEIDKHWVFARFNTFLRHAITNIEAGFSFVINMEDSSIRCVTVETKEHLKLAGRSEGPTSNTPPSNHKIITDQNEIYLAKPIIDDNEHFFKYVDDAILFTPWLPFSHLLRICSTEATQQLNTVEVFLQHNRRSFQRNYRTYMKEMERLRRAYENYLYIKKPTKQFVIFEEYEERQKCRLGNAAFEYVKLKYLLHTITFWNKQVQRMSLYPSISKFVSKRIQDLVLNENKEKVIHLILQLAQEDTSSSHQYLKMLRFAKPPMFDRTMDSKDDE